MEKGRKVEEMTVRLPALQLDGESREFALSLLGPITYVQSTFVLSHVSDMRDTFLKEKK